jgi:hypothetical protein
MSMSQWLGRESSKHKWQWREDLNTYQCSICRWLRSPQSEKRDCTPMLTQPATPAIIGHTHSVKRLTIKR